MENLDDNQRKRMIEKQSIKVHAIVELSCVSYGTFRRKFRRI